MRSVVTGTLINTGTVIAGGTLGTLLGNRFPARVRNTVMDALGLTTILIGLKMAFETSNVLLLLGSLLLGGIVGELLDIEAALNRVARRLEEKVSARATPDGRAAGAHRGAPGGEDTGSRFARGFVTASLVFCVGPMTIMGSIQDGLTGDYSTLAVKAMLDGFAALAFASSLGMGVTFSALVVLVYQGGITMAAAWAQAILTPAMVAEMTATGGLLIFAIGLGLLELKRIRVANLLPAIFVAPLLIVLFR
jgi:uncharacterized membrane protein YqgA involved in biofilm formation